MSDRENVRVLEGQLGEPVEVFAAFDAVTQDSGNVSYGVRAGGDRYFVKTAGQPDNPLPSLSHDKRVALLRNAVRLRASYDHPALPRLHHVIETADGPMLVYEWVNGELLGAKRAHREDPGSAFQRFRTLPAKEVAQALDVVFDLHAALSREGWVAVDFYDGCLIYDFERRHIRVIDLDHYHDGPLANEMGRMFGSTRFMAPEEFELGATIDERTNVFTMGRTMSVFLSDGTLDRKAFRATDALYQVMLRACQEIRADRYESVAAFHLAWATESWC